MNDIHLKSFGGMIYTNSSAIGLKPEDRGPTVGFGTHGKHNLKPNASDENWFMSPSMVMGALSVLKRFSMNLKNIVFPVKNTNYQQIQITSLPVPLLKDSYVTEEETVPAFFGLLSKKVSVAKNKGKVPRMLDEALVRFDRNEPLYHAEWLVPSFKGGPRDSRDGFFFSFTLALGKSDAAAIAAEFRRNKNIIRQIGEAMFPVHFKALESCLPYDKLPHYLFDSADPCIKKPADAPCALKQI